MSSIKIADFFARIGYKVDNEGLKTFTRSLNNLKAGAKDTARQVQQSMNGPKAKGAMADRVIFKRRQIELKRESKEQSKALRKRLNQGKAEIRQKLRDQQNVLKDRLKSHKADVKKSEATAKQTLKDRLSLHRVSTKLNQAEARQRDAEVRKTLRKRLGAARTEIRQKNGDDRKALRDRLRYGKAEIRQRLADNKKVIKDRLKTHRSSTREESQFKGSFGKLQDRLDPLGAATKKYQSDVERLNQALKKGMITKSRYSQLLGRLQVDLERTGAKAIKTSNAFTQFAGKVNNSARILRNFSLLVGASFAAPQIAGSFLDLQRIRTSLVAATGSAQKGAQDFAFLRAEADRVGVSLRAVSKGYVQLAAASKGTIIEGEDTRDLFSSVLEVSRSLQLTTEETTGTIRAFTQMLSKGNVQAEELRGQLGERLAGAFQMSAKAMGMTTQELNKQLELGNVLATDLLPKLSQEMKGLASANLDIVTQDAPAEFNRMGNAILEATDAAGKAGILETFADWFRGITRAIKLLIPVFKFLGVAFRILFLPIKAAFKILEPLIGLFESFDGKVKALIISLGLITAALTIFKRATLLAFAPYLLVGAGFASLILLIEDLATAMRGGSSVIKDISESGTGLAWVLANILMVIGLVVKGLAELAAMGTTFLLEWWRDFSLEDTWDAMAQGFSNALAAMAKAFITFAKDTIPNAARDLGHMLTFGLFKDDKDSVGKMSNKAASTVGSPAKVENNVTSTFQVTVPPGTTQEQAEMMANKAMDFVNNAMGNMLISSSSDVPGVD